MSVSEPLVVLVCIVKLQEHEGSVDPSLATFILSHTVVWGFFLGGGTVSEVSEVINTLRGKLMCSFRILL